MKKKVMVTGCFDMLHSGHVAFLKEAADYGDLYVCIGNDINIIQLKGRKNIQPQEERKYMISALACVKECMINKGMGILDFEETIQEIRPDIFIVNEDGHLAEKEHICFRNQIQYIVLERQPHPGLPKRSTTALRSISTIPFRIDLAGGWLDQPFVSRYYPGPVLTISIEPTIDFNNRSGMASSTRNKAIELWQTQVPAGEKEQLAKILFSYENIPGTKEIAGSQDALGIVMPGLNRFDYDGNYWPEKISSNQEEAILQWLENHIYLIALGPRTAGYDVLGKTNITKENAQQLSKTASACWEALLQMDKKEFSKNFTGSFTAQIAMFPGMIHKEIEDLIAQYRNTALGWKISGAGGGGYLILFSEEPIVHGIKIKIRRKEP